MDRTELTRVVQGPRRQKGDSAVSFLVQSRYLYKYSILKSFSPVLFQPRILLDPQSPFFNHTFQKNYFFLGKICADQALYVICTTPLTVFVWLLFFVFIYLFLFSTFVLFFLHVQNQMHRSQRV